MSQCYCYCHRTYDYCDGKCCEREKEREEKERSFWDSKEGKKIEISSYKKMIERNGYNVKISRRKCKK